VISSAIGYGILTTFAWLLSLGWLWNLLEWLRNFPRIEDLNQITLPPLSEPSLLSDPATPAAPHLTVIGPACNEAPSIAATLRSLLASTGIRLQILAVNDRSTDQTGQIMEEVLADWQSQSLNQNPKHTLEIIHIKELPFGWLGKPHALATAARLARADWILFTDGDVRFAPQAAELALRYAIAHQADHLVLMPDWTMASPGEAAMHGAMHALSVWRIRLWRIPDPQRKDFLGVGAFNLIRRSSYQGVGGFDSLPMEIIEDMRIGWKLKRAGYRQRVVLGPGLAAVRWSRGAWGVVRNLEKNLFALYRFRLPVALFASFGLLVQLVLPLAALWAGGWARAAALVQFAAIACLYVASRKVTRVRPAYVMAYPFAIALFLFAHLRSVTMALFRGGVLWRGTLYSLKDLRAHAGGFWN